MQWGKELEVVLNQKESMWFQKSKKNWIMEGDRNTRYYHTKAVTRRLKNKILALRNSLGDWGEDQFCLKQIACDFYRGLFREEVPVRCKLVTSTSYPRLDEYGVDSLGMLASNKEIKDAFFSMGSFKALRE